MKKEERIKSPGDIKREKPVKKNIEKEILKKREELKKIFKGEEKRKVIITGPCSIHNTSEGLKYAENLKKLQKKVEDKILLVMRTYFEKPRTSVGWKGLVYDPELDGSCKIEEGILRSREFLLKLSEMGIPAGTEILNPIIFKYLEDLISWCSIGARTVESQIHREIASGLSIPVGFKNDTSGEHISVVNAIKACKNSHTFLGIDEEGNISNITTNGNIYGHVILRGGKQNGSIVTNYDEGSVDSVLEFLERENLFNSVVIDCSHDNSEKDFKNQPEVFEKSLDLFKKEKVNGLMLESFLKGGKQDIGGVLEEGVSVTDGCIDWDTTEGLVLDAYNVL